MTSTDRRSTDASDVGLGSELELELESDASVRVMRGSGAAGAVFRRIPVIFLPVAATVIVWLR